MIITCPKGHTNVRETGSIRVIVGKITATVNGVRFVIPGRFGGDVFYKCNVCGAEFSVKKGVENN